MFRLFSFGGSSDNDDRMPKFAPVTENAGVERPEPQSTTKSVPFQVDMTMVISTNNPGVKDSDVRDLVRVWASAYQGPYLLEPMIKAVALAAMYNLMRDASFEGVIKYSASLTDVLTFNFPDNSSIPEQYLNYKYSGMIPVLKNNFSFLLTCRFTHTPLRGPHWSSLLKKDPTNSEQRAWLVDELKTLSCNKFY
ncbi:matrix protein [Durham virus]|uniref:Matrix protein n=1 Tax=Durham virus TaxID=710545 RepID=D6C4E6_9RHAB|nr:matrix protein [Durham virus]ADB88757.1 matrix protein [Durham virus]